MRKEEKLLKAFSDVKEEYIDEVSFEENEQPQTANKTKKTYWVRWVGLAASIALLVFGGMHFMRVFGPFDRFDLGTEVAEEENGKEEDSELLTNLDIIDLEKDMGFSITTSAQYITVYKEEQLVTKNPWKLEMEQLTFPVYENSSFVSIAGAPEYFSEEELLIRAEEIAQKIGATPIEWEYQFINEEGVDKFGKPYMIALQSDIAEIWVEGNGEVRIEFYEGIELPEGYNLSDESTYDEAQATVNYLTETYQNLHEMENPQGDCRVEYDLYGSRYILYVAYDSIEGAEGIAEYCFDTITFRGDEEGRLKYIFFGDVRTASNKLGEYPIITEEVAKERLLSGDYISISCGEDAVGGNFSEENIGKIELVYLTGPVCQYFQPYYCFFVAIDGYSEGVINYAHFYVPALTDEYLDDFPEVNPIGN